MGSTGQMGEALLAGFCSVQVALWPLSGIA